MRPQLMDFPKLGLFLVLILGWNDSFNCERPGVVNIGAILAYDSVIGRVAKAAIETAVHDVNSDKNVLAGTRLNLIMMNSNCNAFLGAIGALKILDREAVAIVGPQVSTTAHMISFISNGLQIPLVSFAATDPTLSSLQYPFFLRMTPSDSYQMKAVANLIHYYGWRQVIAIYVDNEFGRNGIDYLDDELANSTSKIYKIALPMEISQDKMTEALRNSRVIGPRVYVVHASPDSGLDIFSVAQQLNMMTDEYVWLVTDWFCTALGSSESNLLNTLNHLQGIVGFCQYVPVSSQKNGFMSKWEELHKKGMVTSKVNAYGFYAYDTVWAVARAIDDLLRDSGNVTFSSNNELVNMNGKIHFDQFKSFDDGYLLLQKLLLLNFTGITGQIQFDKNRNLKGGAYQIINIGRNIVHTVGYWTSHFGLSISLPNSLHENDERNLRAKQVLGNITWPGENTKTPRGWVAATNEKPLLILVPRRVSFVEFATVLDNHTVTGYCIDVFEAAIKLVPYAIPHKYVPFGDGITSPSSWTLVNMVANQTMDAGVGDITIAKNRTKIVDFTQPYITSGLVIVVPVKTIKSSAWSFLRPFSLDMWCVIGAYFLLIGAVVWLLEHRVNSDFRGPPKRQCLTIFLFSFSSLFHTQKENTVTFLGRFVMVVWFFLLLVITSSYTASLTSFLTIQQLASPISGIDSLIATNEPIGFQESSFARVYMIDVLKIRPSRLVPLRTPEDYAKALRLGPKRSGGVAAIVDELPYVEIFLQKFNGFGLVGEPFTRRGWGFVFPRGSPLAIDLSSAILKLSENGQLQMIHDRWLCKNNCTPKPAKSSDPYRLELSCFRGLFLVCGVVSFGALLIFLLRAIRQFIRFKSKQKDPADSSKGCSHMIYSFFDFLDEKEEAIKKMFKQQNNTSQPEVS
ncbi:glutamate receptor 3.7-like [Asparagus officinalis]|uniref:glutamate receptor 3.7-like n=1 Tax=Asparagus officinalis TaxID=4686 RepID=UPI00098E0747|nr:glutamate receptor 3.7-like [Asparagus officinalis]